MCTLAELLSLSKTSCATAKQASEGVRTKQERELERLMQDTHHTCAHSVSYVTTGSKLLK